MGSKKQKRRKQGRKHGVSQKKLSRGTRTRPARSKRALARSGQSSKAKRNGFRARRSHRATRKRKTTKSLLKRRTRKTARVRRHVIDRDFKRAIKSKKSVRKTFYSKTFKKEVTATHYRVKLLTPIRSKKSEVQFRTGSIKKALAFYKKHGPGNYILTITFALRLAIEAQWQQRGSQMHRRFIQSLTGTEEYIEETMDKIQRNIEGYLLGRFNNYHITGIDFEYVPIKSHPFKNTRKKRSF